MKLQTSKPRHLPLLIGGIAAILGSGIAIGSFGINARGVAGDAASVEAPEGDTAPAAAATRAYKCADCGVIQSMREMESPEESAGASASAPAATGKRSEFVEKPARSYEITIRLQDGSILVINELNPAQWKPGERVKIMAGAGQ